jgi:phosphohistidine phosphatase SixA
MQRYCFFRHGKADALLDDLDRPLTQNGVEKVKQQALVISDLHVDLVICSSALRTQETADLLLAEQPSTEGDQ